MPDEAVVTFTCDCGRRVVCEEDGAGARTRQCSRCRRTRRREAASLRRKDERAERIATVSTKRHGR